MTIHRLRQRRGKPRGDTDSDQRDSVPSPERLSADTRSDEQREDDELWDAGCRGTDNANNVAARLMFGLASDAEVRKVFEDAERNPYTNTDRLVWQCQLSDRMDLLHAG